MYSVDDSPFNQLPLATSTNWVEKKVFLFSLCVSKLNFYTTDDT